MKSLLVFVLLNIIVAGVYAQSDSSKITTSDSVKTKKTNPIIFLYLYVGKSRSWFGGINVNYQFNKNYFFTLRYNNIFKYDIKVNSVFFLPLFPTLVAERQEYELGVLYGYRFIANDYSVSFATGLSYNQADFYNLDLLTFRQRFIGVPFEVNLKSFSAVKKKFRLYFIPITKPTAFASSIGLKLIGNVSKRSFFGVALTYGLGYHKVY